MSEWYQVYARYASYVCNVKEQTVRKIVFESAMSVDGYALSSHRDIPHLFSMDTWLVGCTQRYDTLFLGRKTYERMTVSAYSNARTSDEGWGFFRTFFGLRKYVFSRRERHVIGNGMVVRDDLATEVGRIRNETGKDILFCGGTETLRDLARLDLIDEYIFFIFPVIVNRGQRVFGINGVTWNLHLVAHHATASGIVMLHYIPYHRGLQQNSYGRSIQNECRSSRRCGDNRERYPTEVSRL